MMLTQTFQGLLATLRVKLRFCGLKCVDVVRNEHNYIRIVTKNPDVRELRRLLISREESLSSPRHCKMFQLNAVHLLRPFR
jgi:hypothetical protein